MKLHLYKYGFCPNYFDWVSHGKTYLDLEVNTNEASSMEAKLIQEMVMDAFGPMSSNWIEENLDEQPNEEAQKYFEMLETVKQPLYDRYELSHGL